MQKINLETVQWHALKNIDDVDPINEKDYQILEEMRQLLVKHGYTERFGVCLLHKHFELGDGEYAVEYSDSDARMSTVVAEKHDRQPEEGFIQTMWKFGNTIHAGTVCQAFCSYAGGHRRTHRRVAT